MTKWNKTERKYIDRLFEIKPNCSGEELINLLNWMNTKDMPGWDAHYGHVMDEAINKAIVTARD